MKPAFTLCAFLVLSSLVQGADVPASIPVREIGIPVRSVNWVHLHAGRNSAGAPCILGVMGQSAANLFVLQIDPASGSLQQFVAQVPDASYPTATLMSRGGLLYIGAAYAGHLLCFDPAKGELRDCGVIHAGAATFPCRMDEDAEGRIWIGSYGAADLTSYDPRTGQFEPRGRMDETDMYNYPLVNTDGTVANLIRMTKPHVVVFDPRTGNKQTVGPVTVKGESSLDMLRGTDGKLYLVTDAQKFRIDGMAAVPVDTVPASAAEPPLPDGTTFRFADHASREFVVRTSDGKEQTFKLAYDATGTDIFSLHGGPDGCVYGSSVLPLDLFRYDPASSALTDLGRCSESNGELYSMANFEQKLYLAAYPAARLSVYDPKLPYHFGTDADSNPRDLGRMDDISYRPRSSLAGPLGRVWVASIPDYGRWGGPLSWYEPATGAKKSYNAIAGDASCYTLAYLPASECLAVGTSISGGSGTQPRVSQAQLFLWDYRQERKLWEGTLDRPVAAFNALLALPGGQLLGTVVGGDKPELFVFDPASRTFVRRMDTPPGTPLDLGLQLGPDGAIYGFTSQRIYRLDPQNWNLAEISRGTYSVAGPILGNEIFYSVGPRLFAAMIINSAKP